MNCPDCNNEMEEFTPESFNCEHCWQDITLCKICKIIMKDPSSDICGHPTCVEKKAENMFG